MTSSVGVFSFSVKISTIPTDIKHLHSSTFTNIHQLQPIEMNQCFALDSEISLIWRFSSLRAYIRSTQQYTTLCQCYLQHSPILIGTSMLHPDTIAFLKIMPTKELANLFKSHGIISKDHCAMSSTHIGEHACRAWRSLFGLENYGAHENPLELVSNVRGVASTWRCFDGVCMGGNVAHLVKYARQCPSKKRLVHDILSCVIYENNPKYFTPGVNRLVRLMVTKSLSIKLPTFLNNKFLGKLVSAIRRAIGTGKIHSLRFLIDNCINTTFANKIAWEISDYCLRIADMTLIKRLKLDRDTIKNALATSNRRHFSFVNSLALGNHDTKRLGYIAKHLRNIFGDLVCWAEIFDAYDRVVCLCLQIAFCVLVSPDIITKNQCAKLSGCHINPKNKTQLMFINGLKPGTYKIYQGKLYCTLDHSPGSSTTSPTLNVPDEPLLAQRAIRTRVY
jgi:hypothetical protein